MGFEPEQIWWLAVALTIRPAVIGLTGEKSSADFARWSKLAALVQAFWSSIGPSYLKRYWSKHFTILQHVVEVSGNPRLKEIASSTGRTIESLNEFRLSWSDRNIVKMAKWGEGDPRWIVEERPDATNVNNWHW